MGQMFDKTHNQMNIWRWDNLGAFGDQVNRSNPQTTNLGKVKRTGKRFSLYGSDDLRSKIEPPSCRQYKPGNILAGRPLNWDDIIDEDDDDENWTDPGGPSSGRTRSSAMTMTTATVRRTRRAVRRDREREGYKGWEGEREGEGHGGREGEGEGKR